MSEWDRFPVASAKPADDWAAFPAAASKAQPDPNEEYRPVGGALGVVPLAEDSQGGVHLSVPGMILEPWRAFKRGLARESMRGQLDEAGNPINIDKAQSQDASMVAGAINLGTTATPKFAAPKPKQVVPDPHKEAIAAAERQGVTIPRAAAHENFAMRGIAGALKEVPVVGTPIVNASNKAVRQMERRIGEVSDDLAGGTAATPHAAGESMRNDLTGWIKTVSKDEADEIYAPVEALINPDFRIPLRVTARIVGEIADEAAASKLKPPAIVNELKAAVTDPKGLTYKGLQNLRTQIGDRMSGGIAPEPGMSKRALEAIYAGLSQDLDWLAKKAGGDKGLAAWKSANEAFAKTIAARREALQKVVGVDGNNSPESIVEKLVSMAGSKQGADISRVLMAKTTVGQQAWGELGSAIVNRLGQTKDGFSIAHFRTAYSKLSENGKAALFGPEHKAALDDLNLIGQQFENIQKLGNPSGSGRYISIAGAPVALLTDPISFLGGALGGRAVASILARPVTSRNAADWAKAYMQYATNTNNATKTLADQAWRRLIMSAGLDGEKEKPQNGQPQRFAILDHMLRGDEESENERLSEASDLLSSINALNPNYVPGERQSTNVIDRRGENAPTSIRNILRALLLTEQR
jgi:hypothetical protein